MNSLVHSAASGSIPVADLSALIAKLEAAEGGSRALDGDVAWIFHQKLWGRRNPSNGQHQWMTEIDGKPRVLPRYTTSLDAALALAERVGWRAYSIDMSIIGRASVMLQSLDDRPGTDPETGAYMIGNDFSGGTARLPALALCIAILKAHASRAVEGE